METIETQSTQTLDYKTKSKSKPNYDKLLVKRTDELISSIKKFDDGYDAEMIRRAVNFGAEYHSSQKRQSGEPYIFHPIAVGQILAEMNLGSSAIITAILHDTVEDTEATLEQISEEFTPEISQLVDGVTKLTKIEYQSEDQKQAENFRKFFIAVSEDIRVLLVKLADRTHNMRTIGGIPKPEKRYRIAYETMEIYAPLAERIGMHKLKSELQDIAFHEMNQEAYESIQSRLQYLREEDDSRVERVIEQLNLIMKRNNLRDADISGREKMPYSIWRKMEEKHVSFEQLSDIIAFRIIVDSTSQCYEALGYIHSAYHSISELFKDYVSVPKPNGYQSLHTVVMGPEQRPIEIQIRTKQMHEIAEMGVAAHWSYKQDKSYSMDGKQYRWIREMITILENASGAQEFLDNTKLQMFHDQVFCFTPQGDLIALPLSATAVDFAFAVHSGVGLTCAGAKVNGRIVPLRTKLKNGDQVDIIQSKTQHVSPSWEDFVVTGRARAEIRKFLRHQESAQYIDLGKKMIHQLFLAEGKEFKEKKLKKTLEHFNYQDVKQLYEATGNGTLSRNKLTSALFPDKKKKDNKNSFLKRFTWGKNYQEDRISVPIKGMIPGIAIHFPGCCHPLPGDKISGIVNSGKGITIHTTDCNELEQFIDQPERWIDVEWESDTQDEVFVGRFNVVVNHRRGALAELANIIAKEDGNIHNIRIQSQADDFYEIVLDVEVHNSSHLNKIMNVLRGKAEFQSVDRRR